MRTLYSYRKNNSHYARASDTRRIDIQITPKSNAGGPGDPVLIERFAVSPVRKGVGVSPPAAVYVS